MRSVIVDFARARRAERRGGDADVHAKADPRLAEEVEMRCFGGMTEKEIAEIVGTSARTVQRDWEKAKLLLFAVLG